MSIEFKFRDAQRIVVMGVSGCGKSSVGVALASRLRLPYLEGDDLHPQRNIDKMTRGVSLSDDDRWPWLDAIGQRLQAASASGLIASCSALKKVYRDRLRSSAPGPLVFLYLHAPREILLERMTARSGHFMPSTMLESQLETLEPPLDEPSVIAVDVTQSLQAVVESALAQLEALKRPA